MLAFSADLQVSETVHLKLTDIPSDTMQIRIRQAKGKKTECTLKQSHLKYPSGIM